MCGKVLCHVVVVVFVRVCLVWCVQSVASCVRVREACELHERSPCAPKFADRTQDETLHPENHVRSVKSISPIQKIFM